MVAVSLTPVRPTHGARLARHSGEPAPHPWIAARPGYRWWVVGTVCVGAFLGQLDASIAGLVLPTLERVFRAPVAAVEWVAISYLLTLAALVVPFGRLADMTGRKRLYTAGFLIFVTGSALCGLAPSLGWLIAFRVLQAVGAALLQANSIALIAATARPGELGRAIGVQGAAQAVGLAVGPSVGGLLIAVAGWQWVFFIAVPFGLAGALLGWLVLPQTQPVSPAAVPGSGRPAGERFDWAGATLFGLAVAAGMLALSYANDWGWGSPRLMATAGAAVLLLVAFVLVERRVASPLVDVGLFRNRLFSAGIVAGLLSYAVLFGVLFLVPFYLERVRSLPTSAVGLLLSPVPLALGVLAPLAGLLTDRIGSRLPTVLGMLGATVALVWLAVAPDVPGAVLLAGLALLGIGLGLFTPPNNSAVIGSAPAHRLGLASGVLNMTRSLGTGLGVAATGAVLTLRLVAHTGHPVAGTAEVDPALLEIAFRETLLFLATLAGAAALISAARGPATFAGRAGTAGGAGEGHAGARRIAEAEAMGG